MADYTGLPDFTEEFARHEQAAGLRGFAIALSGVAMGEMWKALDGEHDEEKQKTTARALVEAAAAAQSLAEELEAGTVNAMPRAVGR